MGKCEYGIKNNQIISVIVPCFNSGKDFKEELFNQLKIKHGRIKK